ncbi:MAG: hypothetical protein GX625_03630 [Clostridiaceae bacterium]|nr:hypothetical protein [Clostridiaceae bacterium]
MDTCSVITLLGALAFFLFGMSLMGDGLKKVTGNKLEIFLWKLSNTPLKGLLLGTFVTAIIQSSLQNGQCTINLGFVFNDLLTNYERISDHCNNLANYIVRLSSHIAGMHEYWSGSAQTEIFRVKFDEYKEKYYGQLKDSFAK